MVLYTVYKQGLFVFSLFFFNLYNGMSGTALYDSAMIVCYPVLYSFLPVLYFGILDQSVRASTANTYPQSYYVGQQGRHLNLQQMCMWECKALLHAGLISLLTFNAWGVASSNPYAEGAGSITTHADGLDADMYTVGPLPTTPTTPAPTHPTTPTPSTPTTPTTPTSISIPPTSPRPGGRGGQLHGGGHRQRQAAALDERAHEARPLKP